LVGLILCNNKNYTKLTAFTHCKANFCTYVATARPTVVTTTRPTFELLGQLQSILVGKCWLVTKLPGSEGVKTDSGSV